jgi:Flp pilus assembly protein TadG
MEYRGSRIGCRRLAELLRELSCSKRGAVIVEAAIAIPILITLLLGILTYGGWFMAAHSLQEAANDAARSALAGLDAIERQALVDRSLARSVLQAGTLAPDLVSVETETDGSFYKVMLSYDVENSAIFQSSFVPLPSGAIRREAMVELNSL